MVRGLQLFKEHFATHLDQYVLIGGTACTIVMEDKERSFRATKDLDIVLCIETMNKQFLADFWEFIQKGRYQNRLRSNGKEIFYRFDSPSSSDYPIMIELFCRGTDMSKLSREMHVQHIKMDEATISLSAILLNDDYYQVIQAGKCNILGLPVVKASHLIPLKVRAWIDLKNKQKQGNQVDNKDIRKHKNDIIRIYELLSPKERVFLPEQVKQDMGQFIELIK